MNSAETHSADPEGWRSKAHTFENVPKSVQGYIREQLAIPPNAKAILLPDDRLSVNDFLSGTYIPLEKTAPVPTPKNHQFFTADAPTMDVTSLRSIPIPQTAILTKLVTGAKQAWLDGMSSIKLPNSPIFIPLWAPTYWSKLRLEVEKPLAAWNNAMGWLKRKELLPFKDQVFATVQALSALTWTGNIHPAVPGKTKFTTSTLQSFLSRNWLTDEHMDLLTFLTEKRVKEKTQFYDTHFIDTVLARKIVQIYQEDQSGKSPYDASGSAYWHRFGSKLTAFSHISGIFHIHGNHWVSVVVDAENERILYGDPTGASPDDRVIKPLRWFLSKHVPGLQDEENIKIAKLPCPVQDLSIDWWNCGIFSQNAIAHYFLQRPLLSGTNNAIFMDLARMTAIQDLVEAHQANVPPADAALATTYNPRTDFEPWNVVEDAQPPRPTTPVKNSSSDLIHALKQLSVSPKKPKAKKRKTSKATTSVVAPMFQLPVQRFFPSGNKRKHADLNEEDDQPIQSDDDEDDEEPTDSTAKVTQGRPRLDILDRLTIEVPSVGNTRAHRCAGKNCPKRFKPRSKVRVLMHCKNCPRMTRDQRKLAASASASSAPGALVAKTIKKHSPPSQSTTPSLNDASQSLVPKLPAPVDRYSFFGKAGVKAHHSALDLAVVKLICIARIPPEVVDLNCWKDVFTLQTPSYSPASSTTLSEDHIQTEQAHVRERQIEYLKTQHNISISFDGGAIKSGASVYTIHATTPSNRVVLLTGHDVTGISHTGEMIANLVEEEIDSFGKERVGSVSSDNTGNTRNARERLSALLPNVLNLQDPNHHLNNTWKDIANLEYFRLLVNQLRGILKYFKQSGHAKTLLKQQREEKNLGPGLESIGKTRFATLVWSAVSVQRCLPGIRALCESGAIDIKKWNYVFDHSNPTASLQFEMYLTQFVTIGTPFARAIECLEAAASTPADVFMFWLAILHRVKEALEACFLPDNVRGLIRGIVNSRWNEFFVEGPTNAHLTAFYLNPAYARSPIFKNPNPLSFNIVLPSKEPPKVPPGVKHPKTFLACAEYLFHVLTAEVEHGVDPFLTSFKDKGALFSAQFQQQFSAYAQGNYPFNAPLGLGQTIQAWWQVFAGTENAGILAAGALKLYSAVPHSMADERTMSVITMLNTAQRNRQTVNTVIAHAQVRAFYMEEEKTRVRRSARPNPVVRFFDLDRILRTIDDEKSPAKQQVNYDDSDYEEDVILRDKDDDPEAPPAHFESSLTLPFDDHDEIDIDVDEIREMLSDGPVTRNPRAAPARKEELGKKKEQKASGGAFALGKWL